MTPSRETMTIGIGVLATSEKNSVKPDHLILLADTMGSFGDEYSHPRLHKIFAFPESDLYAVAAGQIDMAAAVLPMIASHVSSIPEETRGLGDYLRAAGQSAFLFKMERFNLSVLPKYGVPPATIAPHSKIGPSSLIPALGALPEDIKSNIQNEWLNFGLGCDLLLGALDHAGQAAMFYLSGDGHEVQIVSFPGFWAIGSGAENAKFWLSHRAHTLGMGIKRAAYHAYEAKLMAEGSAHVNEHLDMLIATKGTNWTLTTHKDNKQTDCPISFAQLKQWRHKYGERKSNSLDD